MLPFASAMLMGRRPRRIRTTTWNPADKSPNVNLTGGNLLAYGATGGFNGLVRATNSVAGGKYMFSYTMVALDARIGTGDASASLNNNLHAAAWAYWPSTGEVYGGGGGPRGTAAAASAGQVVDIAVNFATGKVWVRVAAGLWNNSGAADPATGVGGFDISTILGVGPWFPMAQVDGLSAQAILNCFPTSYPAGFLPWDGAY